MVVLAFSMISYTTGPMLGMFLASIFTPQARVRGLAFGLFFFFTSRISEPDFYQILLIIS